MQQYFGIKKENDTIYLNEKDFNHIKNVMRMSEGTKVFTVYNGIRYLTILNKDLKSVNIIEEANNGDIKNKLKFYVPLLNDEKMSLIFQKCTELGATDYVIVNYERCKYKLDSEKANKKIIRWNKIIMEAAEQSYRNTYPVIEKIINTDEIENNGSVNILCSLDKEDVKPFTKVVTSEIECDNINVVFGPEGGLTPQEERIIVEKGYEKVSLGNEVLRTETVPLFISSVIKYLIRSE